ncbi:AAA family ATPase [Patescibacteria group bacterium]|nr:AAA family ATPase [Patescibacteria group bacterium]
MHENSLIIGIAGRSCSGKSTFAQELHKALGKNKSIHIDIDKFLVNSADFNCKDPSTLESQAIEELKTGLSQLKKGQKAVFPINNFYRKSKLNRPPKSYRSAPTILVESTLTFWDKDIRDLIDIKVFIDVPDNICLERRLKRDLASKQKGTEEYETAKTRILNRWKIISKQWNTYLDPTKKYADIIIPYPEKGIKKVLDFIANKIEAPPDGL